MKSNNNLTSSTPIIDKYLDSGNVPRISVHDLKKEDFDRDYRLTGQPVIITHAFDKIIPVDIPRIRDEIGELNVPIRFLGEGHLNKPKTEWKSRSEVREGTVAEYCALLENGTARKEQIYLGVIELSNTKLYDLIGPCMDEIANSTNLREHFPRNTNLWFAPSGHIEPLHFDGRDGTLIQLKGKKRVSLFSPKENKNLYPFPISNQKMPPNFSQPYIDKPDLEQFPKLAKALQNRKTVVLDEGEALFIPVGWWHEVEALGDDYVCSINRFWKVDPTWRMLQAPRASFFYMLSRISAMIS
jgi:hypothetical protein